MKFSSKDFFNKSADLVTFTEQILKEKLNFFAVYLKIYSNKSPYYVRLTVRVLDMVCNTYLPPCQFPS